MYINLCNKPTNNYHGFVHIHARKVASLDNVRIIDIFIIDKYII